MRKRAEDEGEVGPESSSPAVIAGGAMLESSQMKSSSVTDLAGSMASA